MWPYGKIHIQYSTLKHLITSLVPIHEIHDFNIFWPRCTFNLHVKQTKLCKLRGTTMKGIPSQHASFNRSYNQTLD